MKPLILFDICSGFVFAGEILSQVVPAVFGSFRDILDCIIMLFGPRIERTEIDTFKLASIFGPERDACKYSGGNVLIWEKQEMN